MTSAARHSPWCRIALTPFRSTSSKSSAVSRTRKWLALPEQLGYTAPKFFYSNVFRKAEDGGYLWPGFGHNIRLVKWILQRLQNEGPVQPTPLGLQPTGMRLVHPLPPPYTPPLCPFPLLMSADALAPRSMGITQDQLEAALEFDPKEWGTEVEAIEKVIV